MCVSLGMVFHPMRYENNMKPFSFIVIKLNLKRNVKHRDYVLWLEQTPLVPCSWNDAAPAAHPSLSLW